MIESFLCKSEFRRQSSKILGTRLVHNNYNQITTIIHAVMDILNNKIILLAIKPYQNVNTMQKYNTILDTTLTIIHFLLPNKRI